MANIFLDLECTCWKTDHVREKMETIEIGAVKTGDQFEIIDEFNRFIRPVVVPKLSSFCTRLTSIEQSDVDGAAEFSDVFASFLEWVGPEPIVWYSWGDFDREQLALDIGRLGLTWGEQFSPGNHRNLKKIYAHEHQLDRPVGMMKALRQLDIGFVGRHHRAIDDARHVTKIAAHLAGQTVTQY